MEKPISIYLTFSACNIEKVGIGMGTRLGMELSDIDATLHPRGNTVCAQESSSTVLLYLDGTGSTME